MGFCHIHNHTEYSLLDGAIRIPDMVKRAQELEMDSLAITDHGVMFGVMEFSMECLKAGVKPIIGMEAYVAPGGLLNRQGREENQTYHLLLLAKNLEGYRNLCKLASIAALDGYYYKPRIDHEVLRKYSAGLIGTSACLGSEICQELLEGRYDKAQYQAGMYKEIFGPDNFFIELQDHRIPEQQQIKDSLIRIARELDLPLVATNDAHYLCQGDDEVHDVLLCIQTGAMVRDEKRMRFPSKEFYLKSPREMAELFKDTPEALENTLRIAEMCTLELGKQKAEMPDPELPEGETPVSYLRSLCQQFLPERIKNADERSWERLQYELDVIESTGFASYFLLVREFANFTRDSGIYFGVRGSAAGSLVSYCLGITDVDPLEYDLTFERFLNRERIAMPDIDMDFEDARRDEVIKWVTQRYGKERVAQIVTFGTMGAKAAIKDCGRVMGYAPQETDRICKTIPNVPGMSISRALTELAEFRSMVEAEPNVARLVDYARSVEGMARHCGVHAAGVVIAKEPLVEYIPLYKGTDGQAITAFEMGILEKIGLLKMDFLGLSNLTVLARAVEYIKASKGVDVDVRQLPLDDQATYEMLSRGDTVGVFQLESGGMRRHIVELKPQNVRELAAMVALYRPGPMEHIARFVDNKFGREEIDLIDPRMEPILRETYGIIVYQDQVLKLVQALGGFTLGKADVLRRAMGKKDKQAMDSMMTEFMAGTDANGISREAAGKIWELLMPFAGYAFNKAHAVCYALLAYQTAYLKANYPVEYMAALLAVYRDKEDRVINFIEECRRQKISVLPPDVNRSGMEFQPEDSQIRFGLGAIKGVGDGVVKAIIEDRKSGPYTHLFEFAERIKPFGLNRAALEALIKAGALDCIDRNRKKLLAATEFALSYADNAARMKEAGQDSLFGEPGPAAVLGTPNYPDLPSDIDAPNRFENMAMEKEVVGIYISDHPLRGFERQMRQGVTHSCAQIEEVEDGATVSVSGIVSSFRTIVTKSKGEKMAMLVIEDLSGQANVTAFPATYAKYREEIVKDALVKVRGVVMHRERPGRGAERSIEIRLEEISPLQPTLGLVGTDLDAPGTIHISFAAARLRQLEQLKQALESHAGLYEVQIEIITPDGPTSMMLDFHVDYSKGLVESISRAIPGAKVSVTERDGYHHNGAHPNGNGRSQHVPGMNGSTVH